MRQLQFSADQRADVRTVKDRAAGQGHGVQLSMWGDTHHATFFLSTAEAYELAFALVKQVDEARKVPEARA